MDYHDGFDEFWAVFPRKVGKDAARRAFAKRRFTREQVSRVMASVEEHKTWAQWQEAGGRYIPHPATFLNQARWLDVAPAGQFDAHELSTAAEIRRRVYSQCPHDPRCQRCDECVRVIASERRQKATACKSNE